MRVPLRFAPVVALLVAAVLCGPGCGSLGPSDEPLPTFEELRAEFGVPEPGTGVVREQGGAAGGARYMTMATHSTSGQGTLARFRIRLSNSNMDQGLTLFTDGVTGEDLQLNQERGIGVLGRGGNGGQGRLQITAVDGETISGVFVADLVPGGLYPDYPRVSGAFTAVPDTTQSP